MKQVIVRKGKVLTEDIPLPAISDKKVLVQVCYSCISAGTEVMGIEQSGKGIIKKAMEQPQKIRQAVDMYKSSGLSYVLNKVEGMGAGKATGYSASGIVVAVGNGITDIKAGEKVAVAGAGYANHAEVVEVPRNLVMKIPSGLDLKEASTVTLGGIAMQGIRRYKPELGETVAVVGLGLIGQLCVQILAACGCHVIGIDPDLKRTGIAQDNGCELTLNSIVGQNKILLKEYTDEYGVDGVIITAATHSDELLTQCFHICRKKGRVVLIGVIGCTFEREAMYEKELDFYISTSYGPGRYDPSYEEQGQDYPYAYVRWTENRNMLEYLNLLKMQKIKISSFISKEFAIEHAEDAFSYLTQEKPLITLLRYDRTYDAIKSDVVPKNNTNTERDKKDKYNVAIVGAGEFAKATHLPNLEKLSNIYNIYAIMSHTGMNAKNIAEQYHADYFTTDFERIINDEKVDLVIICTRHNLHVDLAVKALLKNKSVLLEKPLALNMQELERVMNAAEKGTGTFMVGYNRRFSPSIRQIRNELKKHISPIIINYQMNAGYIPMDSWVHSEEGGGRIIGEMCHIIDLCSYLVDSEPASISVDSVKNTGKVSQRDNLVVTISYDDGSLATILYTAVGNMKSGKERCSIYFDRKTIEMLDYKDLAGYGVRFKVTKDKRQNKGHLEELKVMYEAMRKGIKYPIKSDCLKNTSVTTFLIEEACKQ